MLKEIRQVLNTLWARLRRTEGWIYGMSQIPLIIEEGTEGIWRYRKWSNGVAECEGHWTGTLSHYSTVFGGYAYNSGRIDYPINLFIEMPKASFSGTVGTGFCCTGTVLNSDKNAINCFVVSSASGSQTVNLYITAVGYWKEPQNTPTDVIETLYNDKVWDYLYLNNLPKINGQTISGDKTFADYGVTGEIAGDRIAYTTEAPTEANLDGLKFCVLDDASQVETRYDGWVYLTKSNLGHLNFYYPVGSYYETSDNNFNPNIAFGGTWVTDSRTYTEEKTLLWTNETPTTQFAASTVQLDLSPYNAVEIEIIDYISYQDRVSHLKLETTDGKSAIASVLLSGSGQHGAAAWFGNRIMRIDSAGVYFDAGYGAAGTGNYSVRNDALIPYKIIGIKYIKRWHRIADEVETNETET